MGPDGVFVQFTYGLLSPIPREACAGRYAAQGGAPIWRNLPPARVWTYRLDAHAAGAILRRKPIEAALKRDLRTSGRGRPKRLSADPGEARR